MNAETKPKPSRSSLTKDDVALLEELGTLHHYLAGLPDLRIDKVFAVRRAVRNGEYDRRELIDSLLDRMSNEIGVLCRRQTDA